MTRHYQIVGGRIVTPTDVVERGTVTIDDGVITDVSGESREAKHPGDVDAQDRIVLPGLVDLHGDEHERYLQPREGSQIPECSALTACDRVNLASGITTKYHAVAFEESPEKNRSLARAAETVDTIRETEELLADHRVHARCEVSNPESVETVADIAADVDLVSLMNHVPGNGQFDDEQFERRYGVADGGTVQFVKQRKSDEVTISEREAHLTERALSAGTTVATHDDDDPTAVERRARTGVDICEYPVTLEATRRADELGLTTALGAPNLVRGHSMWGNLDAPDAVDAGVVDALCSDFHPYSMLLAPFVQTGEPLPDRVARVSYNPANAVGLSDRGRIAAGARADLIVVDPDPYPRVERVFVSGQEVYRVGPTASLHDG